MEELKGYTFVDILDVISLRRTSQQNNILGSFARLTAALAHVTHTEGYAYRRVHYVERGTPDIRGAPEGVG